MISTHTNSDQQWMMTKVVFITTIMSFRIQHYLLVVEISNDEIIEVFEEEEIIPTDDPVKPKKSKKKRKPSEASSEDWSEVTKTEKSKAEKKRKKDSKQRKRKQEVGNRI